MSQLRSQKGSSRWLSYVQAYVQAYALGEQLSCATRSCASASGNVSTLVGGGVGRRPVVVLCSPHPDDEMLTGALPLRLQREQGARVINLAVTLGSAPSRQSARWQELQAACVVAGFECQQLEVGSGFNLKLGEHGGPEWSVAVEALGAVWADHGPDLVFLPHAEDHHPAHVATHRLVVAALEVFTSAGGKSVLAVETEYWRPMASPNLLVGLDAHDVAWLLEALSCHRGEIERNPYHLTQPPRMMDTVRRGSELVKVMNRQRPEFLFGELYRVTRWQQGCGHAVSFEQGWLGPGQDLGMIFTSK